MVDGRNITEDAFARLTGLMKPEVEAVNSFGQYGRLTTFELLTALGFLYDREVKADYQVLEVGLGGRLDATNIIEKPEVCVITSISYDHMDVLGHTLTQIAAEKCGIIKPGCVAVSSPQNPEAMAVIERVCREKGVRLIRVGKDVTWQRKSLSPDGQSLTLTGFTGDYDLTIPLVGEHQLENAAAAVTAVTVLQERGAKISREAVIRGMRQVDWPGRLQILRRMPYVVVDGAHNADSSRKLMKALKQYFPFQRLFLIFGASSDKDLGGIVAELAPYPDKVIIVRAHHPRAVAPEALVAEFAKHDVNAEAIEETSKAVDTALSQTTPHDLICATGSLFVVAEVMEYLRKR
jgi:dihydrofolate synthase/folylpolyglutamate synthase